MKTTSKNITIEKASELLKSKNGIIMPNTEANRKMMKQAIDNLLMSLRKNK